MKKIFNIAIVIICFGVLIFVVYSNLRDWNRLEVFYQFKDDGRVYGLYPSDRVSEIYETRDTRHETLRFQELVSSPVYLDVRYWQNFEHARVEIEYEKDSDVEFQIGYKVGKDFTWKLIDVEEKANRHFDQSEYDERSGEIPSGEERANDEISRLRYVTLEMTLDGEYVPHNNVHRWIFSSSNVQELNKTIRVYGIKFTFTR